MRLSVWKKLWFSNEDLWWQAPEIELKQYMMRGVVGRKVQEEATETVAECIWVFWEDNVIVEAELWPFEGQGTISR